MPSFYENYYGAKLIGIAPGNAAIGEATLRGIFLLNDREDDETTCLMDATNDYRNADRRCKWIGYEILGHPMKRIPLASLVLAIRGGAICRRLVLLGRYSGF